MHLDVTPTPPQPVAIASVALLLEMSNALYSERTHSVSVFIVLAMELLLCKDMSCTGGHEHWEHVCHVMRRHCGFWVAGQTDSTDLGLVLPPSESVHSRTTPALTCNALRLCFLPFAVSYEGDGQNYGKWNELHWYTGSSAEQPHYVNDI